MSHHHTGPATLSFIIFFTKLSPRCPHYDTEAFRTITFHFQKTFLISLLLVVSTIMSNIFMGQQAADIIISSHLTIETTIRVQTILTIYIYYRVCAT